jgi:UDP-N-acetylmuramoyl-tripeptide--D-alanyl-D-alanine ligase
MMSIQDAATMVQGKASGGNPTFTGVSTDTRTVRAGELFVALRGERFDGHGFLDRAKQAGAVAAMVDRAFKDKAPMPAIVVDDTKLGLGALAKGWRGRFQPALIAVTGSNGKTTVKEMLAAILRQHFGDDAVLATSGNLNNDIGLPLTLLRLQARHRCCAIELGMNHKGEIAYLAAIAAPTVALVNNAQREHLEFMKSVEEVAAENASVYAALPADGVAVVNADDAHADFFRKAAGKRRVVGFGLEKKALVSGSYALKALTSEIDIRTPAGEAHATLTIPGLHNVRNALAAAACAHAVGIDMRSIGEGLSAFRPYTGRFAGQGWRRCDGYRR